MKDILPPFLAIVIVIGVIVGFMKLTTWLGDQGIARQSVCVVLSEPDRQLLREIRDALKESKK